MRRSSWLNRSRRNAPGPFTAPSSLPSIPQLSSSQQPGDRNCSTEAIGGNHFGPVAVYMTKVADATTADGSTGWFKIFEDSWAAVAGASNGETDDWGTDDLNSCCGKMAVKIPSDIPAGDYLLRAEVIALHVASSVGGAQFYMSCCMFLPMIIFLILW